MDPQDLKDQGQDVVPVDGLVEDEEGQHGDENGVAGEDHRHDVGLAAGDGQLVEHHAQGNIQQAGEGKVPQVGGGEPDSPLFQGMGRHGDQAQPAHQKPLHGDLEGVEGPGHGGELEQNLHGGENHGSQGDAHTAQGEITVQWKRLPEQKNGRHTGIPL